ncbi:MAG TPA: Asp-tRNA(Asn)/Glu-tRNA(Gln) amidotransferase subunit GatC [Ignavibacteriaceae bacterium]|nr:Asp-tRNA(Asn)/Glu-tRNA(Gln) amidotransferase subunit GatC [Ignavibacteriaceae bacterium]
MAVTKKDVEHIAELAKLKLNEEEIEKYTLQLNDILNYVDKLNELDTSNVEPLSYPVEGKNVFREDVIKTSLDREEALRNAPDRSELFFKVPKVIRGNK